MNWALVCNMRLAVGRTCNDHRSLHNTACGPGRYVKSRSRLKALKNLHLTVPKTASGTDQNHVDGYALFHVHCSTKSQEYSKRSKILNSQVSYQKKKQAESLGSVPRSALYVTTSE